MIWPAIVFAISVAFFLIFKRPITDLCGRIKSVDRDGFQTLDGRAGENKADPQKAEAEMEARIRAANKQEIADLHAKLVEAQQSIAEVKAELLRFQAKIGYKGGELH